MNSRAFNKRYPVYPKSPRWSIEVSNRGDPPETKLKPGAFTLNAIKGKDGWTLRVNAGMVNDKLFFAENPDVREAADLHTENSGTVPEFLSWNGEGTPPLPLLLWVLLPSVSYTPSFTNGVLPVSAESAEIYLTTFINTGGQPQYTDYAEWYDMPAPTIEIYTLMAIATIGSVFWGKDKAGKWRIYTVNYNAGRNVKVRCYQDLIEKPELSFYMPTIEKISGTFYGYDNNPDDSGMEDNNPELHLTLFQTFPYLRQERLELNMTDVYGNIAASLLYGGSLSGFSSSWYASGYWNGTPPSAPCYEYDGSVNHSHSSYAYGTWYGYADVSGGTGTLYGDLYGYTGWTGNPYAEIYLTPSPADYLCPAYHLALTRPDKMSDFDVDIPFHEKIVDVPLTQRKKYELNFCIQIEFLDPSEGE
ncbi:MAG: hypothetical protein LBT00_13315 [Spirochaetaceae bacterium]|jgi:hypothetical protein|nr:hypothetical protein [Spirochaetaceae bacterium]